MKVSRRDLLIGSAGIGAGLVFTPVPWKLLGDVSIWTQNWPWIPQPAHAPIETKRSACTLCPAGCALRVRMAAGYPIGISGLRTHPVTHGALCPLAFAAHQMNWHPQRLREVRHRGHVASWAEAQTAFAKACAEGAVAIVDGRPGRAASEVFEAFTAKHNGSYRVALSPETQSLAPYAEWSGVPVASLGYDLENARTIISFGAALLDGWGVPGQFTRLWSQQAAGASDPRLRLIQIEPRLSRTASRAWRWVPLREGTEPALAAALARVLIEERLVNAQSPVPQLALEDAAAQTGQSVAAIRALAHLIVERRPALVIARDANPWIAALNVLLGSVFTPGGVVLRRSTTASRPASASPSGALRSVLVDSTVPWDFTAPAGAEVFRFAAWDGGGSNADWLLPAPGFLEELTDVPTAPTSALETYAIAVNLLAPAEQAKTPAQFLAQLDSSLPQAEKLIHARCEAIFHARRGTLYTEQAFAVTTLASGQKLEEQLRNGAVWVGEPPHPVKAHCDLREWPADFPKTTTPDWAASWTAPVMPPLSSKLYQESSLREPPAGRRA